MVKTEILRRGEILPAVLLPWIPHLSFLHIRCCSHYTEDDLTLRGASFAVLPEMPPSPTQVRSHRARRKGKTEPFQHTDSLHIYLHPAKLANHP